MRDRTGLGFRVARALHGRWQRLGHPVRERLEPLAEDVRERALDVRGAGDRDAATDALNEASERLAGAMVESAEADPEVSEQEVVSLRDDLASELARLASADIRAERTRDGGGSEEDPAGRAAPG